MMRRIRLFLLLLLCALPARAQSSDTKAKWLEKVVDYYSSHADFSVVTARLNLGRDTALAYRELDTLLDRHYGDMFWAMWSAGTYYAANDALRPEYKARIRNAWKIHTPYRGDTENHFLMYYTGWFLMAQAFPNEPGSEWFNGKSSQENYDDARGFLVHWVQETARYGQTEWDSPRYGYYYITPLVLLSEYTKDARLKKLFTNALELTLADYAIEYLDGNYCGAHSRVSDAEAIDARHNEIAAYGAYFFGDSVTNILPDVAFVALSHFECPQIIRDIALDRKKPYEAYEFKRGRTTIRHSTVPNAPVYKYTYMGDSFALGSMQGGLVQPIQQQSWSLVLTGDSTPNVVTGLHPYFDSSELTMFFPEYPEFMIERIGAVKEGYPNEDKWVGGSPYEHIDQSKNLLIATYDLPDSVTYHHVDLFVPWQLTGFDTVLIRPLWIDITSAKFPGSRAAIRPLVPFRVFTEPNGTRIRMYDRHSGYAVFADDGRKYNDVTFVQKLKSLALGPTATPNPIVKKFGRDHWLYYSPYITSRLGSGIVTLTHGSDTLTLDFN